MKHKIISLCSTLLLMVAAAPAFSEVRVTMIGDSITQGWPYRQVPGDGCTHCGIVEPKLEAHMDGNSLSSGTVYNYGIGGELSGSGASRVQGVINSKNPKAVLFMEGTNDLFWLSPSTVKYYVQNAMNTILNNDRIAIIGTLLPDTRGNTNNEKQIPLTNTLIRDMISSQQASLAAQGKYVYLAELYNADSFYGWAARMYDGLHPNNSTGAQLAADVWYDALKGALDYEVELERQEAERERQAFLKRISGALQGPYLLLLE